MSRITLTLSLVAIAAGASPVLAQDSNFARKRIPSAPGFRVYIVPDMEGMGSAVNIHEVIAGTEGESYRNRTSTDYWNHYRDLYTREVNSTIAGARRAGARSFVISEGHGANRFASLLPWEVDQEAIVIRGFPRPVVMMTAIDSSFGTVMFTGAHANAGSPGVMAHNYAFDTFVVNGKRLNEVGINALIAGEHGVSVSLVSGDDVVVEEAKQLLGNGVIGVVVKTAVGTNAAITYSPTKVRQMLQEAAAEAVRREQRGEFAPFTLQKPYQVEFALRAGYPPDLVQQVEAGIVQRYGLEKTGDRSYKMVARDAKQIGYMIDVIEEIVIR